MIYAYRPKRKSKAALLLVGGLLFLFLSALVYAPFAAQYRGIAESVSLLSLTVAVWVAGRYLLRNYIYSIEEGTMGPDLIVVEWQAKRRSTVARIALSEIVSVERETKETRQALKARARAGKHYDYTVELSSVSAVYVFFKDNDREAAIRFSPDERMEMLLREASRASRFCETDREDGRK